MQKKIVILLACVTLWVSACKNTGKITADEAGEVITDYLKNNPEYKTGKFHFGEMKFNSKSERVELEKYKALENDGYISMDLREGKKKFLSRDSSFIYIIKLKDKASELVIRQDENKATVKVALYELSDEKPVNFNLVNDHQAKVTVTLKKVNTAFGSFQKNNDENSEFITRTYRLKLDKEEGWRVAK
ncbi:hypothetical protein D9M68_447060 [compost metagenome]